MIFLMVHVFNQRRSVVAYLDGAGDQHVFHLILVIQEDMTLF